MTPASFAAWRERLYGPRGITAAAKALGCSRTSIRAWETGEHGVPLYISLACAALELSRDPPQESIDLGYNAFCESKKPNGLRFLDAHKAMIEKVLTLE